MIRTRVSYDTYSLDYSSSVTEVITLNAWVLQLEIDVACGLVAPLYLSHGDMLGEREDVDLIALLLFCA